jgi:minor histocompatibility antigen H13
MVTVAKSVDAPIKLMFPIDMLATPPKFSMLGLGDIVIPGIFVALCLKFDVDRHLKNNSDVANIQTPYFNICFIGYILGIVSTFAVMIVF